MLIKERVIHELNTLDETELRQISDYVAFLKYQARMRPKPILDEARLAGLYAEFADEDRDLAEEGL